MRAGHHSLLQVAAVCAVLVGLGACGGTMTIASSGNMSCDALVQIARTTGPTYSYLAVDESGALPRTGLAGIFGKRTTSTIFVRTNHDSPGEISPAALQAGVVIARVESNHSDKRLKTKGGQHYWAVAATSDTTGISVMAPVATNKKAECTTLYIKDRGNQLPYNARYIAGPAAAGLLLRVHESAAEGVWEACGMMCCCAGRRDACEDHDVALAE